MKPNKKIFRIFLRALVILIGLSIIYGIYSNSLLFVNDRTIDYYEKLQELIVDKGYEDEIYVISGKRFKPINDLLVKFGNAVRESRHLKGKAIDILVFDVNNDGKSNHEDVDLVYNILDRKVIKDRGGLGTYKNKSCFFTRQMIHFDSRGHKIRWNK